MSNYSQNNGLQKRMIIMTVLVFVFFIAYEFLVLKPKQEERAALAKIEQEKKENAAPEVAPVVVDANAKTSLEAPKSTDNKIVTKIKTQSNIIEIDNLGRVAQVTLLEEKYKNDKGEQIKLFSADQLRPLETRFADSSTNEEAFKTSVVASLSDIDATNTKQELVLTQTLSNTVLTKKFTFYPDGHYDLKVTSTNDKKFFITNGFRPNVIADMYAVHGFMGPKNYNDLKALNPELIDVIDYGWFTFIAKPMFTLLQFIQSYVGNWGWTIVILTILIKLVLYPLSYKGMMSMQKLKDLAPKIKEIQLKHKDDKQKQSMAMMELYKKSGANPMGGCLPLLLQIPVFFAIYRVLINAIELKGAEWILWIKDLAEMDPWFVLPILMGVTMFIQQKITPNAMQDEMQKKIFQLLPIIFTFFFLWFPAGLTLYWFVNNVFTIAQQYTINRIFEKKRVAKN